MAFELAFVLFIIRKSSLVQIYNPFEHLNPQTAGIILFYNLWLFCAEHISKFLLDIYGEKLFNGNGYCDFFFPGYFLIYMHHQFSWIS